MQMVIHENKGVYFQALVFLTVDKTVFKDLKPAVPIKYIIPIFYGKSDKIELIFEIF